MTSSSSNSPCAACKCLRRKCTPECVFAPYFPPDNPQKFANVHKVFGASNVAKILNELNANQCEDAVNSLAYEAEHRMRDPVYGCVGLISILQQKLKQVQRDLDAARKELAAYVGSNSSMFNHLGLAQQQSLFGQQQLMIMGDDAPQEQILEQQVLRFNVPANNVVAMGLMPSLALGSVHHHHYHHHHEINSGIFQREGQQVIEEQELQTQLRQTRSELILIQQQNNFVALNDHHNHLQQPRLAKQQQQQIVVRAKSEEDRASC